jgi:hypothetical protein
MRALERRWKETGSDEDLAALLRARIRAGRDHPAKLWMLARHPLAEERDAIQLALGERIPYAPSMQGGLEVGHAGATPLSGHFGFWEWLVQDIEAEVEREEYVPLERAIVRQQAWAEVMRGLRDLLAAQHLPTLAHNAQVRANGLEKGAAAAASYASPEFTDRQRQGVVAMLVNEQAAGARALEWFLYRANQGGLFQEWHGVPERWADEAQNLADDWDGYEGELLEEIMVERWPGFVGYPIEAAEPNEPMTYALVTPEAGIRAEWFYRYLQQRLLAWLRGQPVPEPPAQKEPPEDL